MEREPEPSGAGAPEPGPSGDGRSEPPEPAARAPKPQETSTEGSPAAAAVEGLPAAPALGMPVSEDSQHAGEAPRPFDSADEPDAHEAEPAPAAVWPEDSLRHPLPDRAVGANRIANLIFAGPASLAVCVFWVLNSMDILHIGPDPWIVTLVGLAVILFLLVRALAWPAIAHRHRAWRLTPEVLDIWEGVLFRRVISVPRSRVQHTEVGSGPIQRSYDLATLSVYTAGEERVEIGLHGLEVQTAEAIRDCLLNREEDHVV